MGTGTAARMGDRLSLVSLCLSAAGTILAVQGMATARTYDIQTNAANAPNTPMDGKCGLLEAVAASIARASRDACLAGSGNDIIKLGNATYTVPSAIEIYSTTLTITGTGMANSTISSSNLSSPSFPTGLGSGDCSAKPAAVYVTQGALVTFSDLTLRPASGIDNQGICLSSATVTLNGARVTRFLSRGIWAGPSPSQGDFASLTVLFSLINFNFVVDDGFGGAGIYFDSGSNPGVFSVENSTIANNTSQGNGGGVVIVGNQIFNRHIWRSTISDNVASGLGGGLYLDADSYLQFSIATVANNHAFLGGGIYKAPATGNLDLGASIVNNNMADGDAQQANLSTDGLAPNNVSCNGSLMFLSGSKWTADSVPLPHPPAEDGHCEYGTANALLDASRGWGGPNNLPVLRPLTSSGGSHAIDTDVFSTSPSTDQRDLPRPMDGKNLGGAKLYDRGAVELRPLQLETESLTVAAKSSDTHAIANDGCSASVGQCWYSGGTGTNLQANADNDFVTYQTSLASGTYAVSIRYKKGSNAGRFQVQWSSTVNGTYSNIGSVQEGFSASPSWVTVNLANITVSSGGTKYFKFLVTGKNASSSGRQVFPDYIDLVK